MRERVSLGVDLGGTKIEAVLVRHLGFQAPEPNAAPFEVLARQRVPTPGADGYQAVLSATRDLIRSIARDGGYDAPALPIGVGMPGAISGASGTVKNSNTLCLNGRKFHEDLRQAVGAGIVFENDANCFALAEAHLGAARGACGGLVFGAILGTGVGGGVIFKGQIWTGPQNLGGEWGHHAVGPWRRQSQIDARGAARDLGLGLGERERCYCGKTGCLELYASGKAVELDYRRRGGQPLSLQEIAARRDTDSIAAAAIDELLEAFGRAVANLIDILDPSAIVLGGGVSNLEALYSEGVQRVRNYVFNEELLTPILRHALGDSAGVLGAALLAV